PQSTVSSPPSLHDALPIYNLTFTYEDDHYVIEIPVEFHSENNNNFKKRMEEEFETEMVTLRYDEKGKRWLVHSSETILFGSNYLDRKSTRLNSSHVKISYA